MTRCQAIAALQLKAGFQRSRTASFFARALAPPTQPALNASALPQVTGKKKYLFYCCMRRDRFQFTSCSDRKAPATKSNINNSE